MRTKQTVISLVVLTVLLSLLLVSPVAGVEVAPRTIKVFKLHDINGNGEQDEEDKPKEGWLMSVYAHDGTEWVLIGQGSTDANGYVTFTITTQSTGDNYMVVEEARECWWPTFPDVEEGYGGYYVVRNVPAGEQRTQWFKNTNECGGEGCTLTPGYWKTHSKYGPAPYDATWAEIGEDTPFFASGKTWYDALWTEPKGGEAYYILAHAYIAAALNFKNGADPVSCP